MDFNDDIIEKYNIECDKGWFKIIEKPIQYIENYNKDKSEDEKIMILQIKEKFGTLRFYTNFTTQELEKLIEEAEDKSARTCEYCGSEEDVGMTVNGWIKTLCRNCVKELSDYRSVKWKSYKDGSLYTFLCKQYEKD